jgi:putative transposase
MRHTTFRYALDPTPAQDAQLARHAGARRFAYNQCLRLVKDALDARQRDPTAMVPWTGFDLIKMFNAWKTTEAAGRRFVAAPDGTITTLVTGLPWRGEVSQQIFEEAAVDLSRGLAAWDASRKGERPGPKIEFPTFRRKTGSRPSFRLRDKGRSGRGYIRVGDRHPRSVTLPTLGNIRVHDNTRPLRRLLRPIPQPDPTTRQIRRIPRARILFATVTRRADRWYVGVTVEAPDLHPTRQHQPRPASDHGGWIGLDRGLTHLVVAATADRVDIGRFAPPRSLARALPRLRHRSRTLNRRRAGYARYGKASERLVRLHAHIANQRRWWLHQVTTQLVQTHDRLALETLATSNLLRNRRLARAIADAAWAELRWQLTYKQRWHNGQLRYADRWFASSKTCSGCHAVKPILRLAERVYRCEACGLVCDRDVNAAANLAAWAETQAAAEAA